MGNLLCGTGTKEEREQAKINKWWSITDINEQHNREVGTKKHKEIKTEEQDYETVEISTKIGKKKPKKKDKETDTTKHQGMKIEEQHNETIVSTKKGKKKVKKQHKDTIDTTEQQETKTDEQQMATVEPMKDQGYEVEVHHHETVQDEKPIKTKVDHLIPLGKSSSKKGNGVVDEDVDHSSTSRTKTDKNKDHLDGDKQPCKSVRLEPELIALTEGMDLVKKAEEEDKYKHYEEAIRLYDFGVEFFQHAIKYELYGNFAKDHFRQLCLKYQDRADELKKQHKIKVENTEQLGKHHIDTADTSERSAKKSDESSTETIKKKNNVRSEKKPDESVRVKIGYTIVNAVDFGTKAADTVVEENLNIHLEDDVAGLGRIKEALIYHLVMPFKFPHLFTGQREKNIHKSILLFGPPGTGKFLVKGFVQKANYFSYFSVPSLCLVSNSQKESEMMVKHLFELARGNEPSIIFIDEVDLLCFSSKFKSESARIKRIQTVLIEQMEYARRNDDGIFVLGATSAPWLLDYDMKNIFGKRIYTSLPEARARSCLFKIHLGSTPNNLTERDFTYLGQVSDGYSGADLKRVVNEAVRMPLRKKITTKHFRRVSGECPYNKGVFVHDMLEPCAPSTNGAIEMSWTDVPREKLKEPDVTRDDMVQSLRTKEPALIHFDKYESLVSEFGLWEKDMSKRGTLDNALA